MPEVHGVLIIARNGDRTEFYQDPYTYEPSYTESTPLGAVESHQLGSYLRSTYLNPSSPSYIKGIHADLVQNDQLAVHAKAGGEGTAIFDSAIAVLQGLYPPNSNNEIELANGTKIVTPLGGYQYVPVEMAPSGVDRALEPWTQCPAFEQHIKDVYASKGFEETATSAERFFSVVRDYVFGRPTELENAIYDYINSQLTHNQTYAYRLPPTYIEQAHGYASYHENAIFSDKEIGGIGNIAGRTILHPILHSLERITFDSDPLKFLLLETSYQPFISLFHMMEMVNEHPQLAAIPNHASALAFEILRGPPPELREFLRIKFKNGTSGEFETYPIFGHKGDIAVTEFLYRLENFAISSQKQWESACGVHSGYFGITSAAESMNALLTVFSAFLLLGMFALAWFKRRRGTSVRVHDVVSRSNPRWARLAYGWSLAYCGQREIATFAMSLG
ncbi:histidine phosphatase superfamily [Suillus paluster]|uniref:histidine phosphatase superfamily n=1 Tax=Suillus paluster TaxID=48578 RepID=UPI001B8707F4|nr:histidine phosphatase superfamily [Suillus paluster]KAG1729353.1 histidine phosphatase superfamily [Suillus paluster]